MMADDPADGVVVLFGGIGAAKTDCNNTWEFKAGVWTNVTSGLSPIGRFWGSMSYDTAAGRVILFGGNHNLNPEYTNDTWSFHAGVWTQLTPSGPAPGRDDQNQVDDVADHEVVMFGGLDSVENVNDTWTYTDGNWAQVDQSNGGPDARGRRRDGVRRCRSICGDVRGYPANTYYYSTWVFHAGAWTRYALTPTAGAGTIWGQMAYDAADQYVVLFQGDGAYNSTWEFNFTAAISPPLSVSANAAPLSGGAPLLVAFSASASASGGTAPYSYAWNFGDSGTSSVESVTHTYTKTGMYTATLNVTDSGSGKFTKSWSVNVQATGLSVVITASPTSTSVNQTVTFTSTVSGGIAPYSFLWNFSDHTTASTQNTTHQYASKGVYLVVLAVRDSEGTSVSRNVTISVSSSANSAAASNSYTVWILLPYPSRSFWCSSWSS